MEVLDSRRLGGAWVLDRLWERLEIGQAIRRVAAGRRLDGEAAERVIFALAAQRALEPASKLAATRWVAERVFIEGCPGFSDDAAYRAMDFLLAALEEIAAEIFYSVAHLLNLDVDIVFVDTTSTYWEMEVAAELAESRRGRGGRRQPARTGGRAAVRALQGPPRRPAPGGDRDGGHPGRDPGALLDLPRQHRAIRRSSARSRTTWPGGTCAGWCGSPTAASPRRPTGPTSPRAAGITSTPRSSATPTPRPLRRWPGRAATAPSPGTCGSRKSGFPPGTPGRRAERFVVCHNPEQAGRDQLVRGRLVDPPRRPHRRLRHVDRSAGATSWRARLRDKPGLRRFLRRTPRGLLRIDKAAIAREAGLDGKWLLRTNDDTPHPR